MVVAVDSVLAPVEFGPYGNSLVAGVLRFSPVPFSADPLAGIGNYPRRRRTPGSAGLGPYSCCSVALCRGCGC